MSEVKKIIKKKRVVSGKSFRLLDFHIFDQQTKEHDSDESSTEKQSSKQIEPKHFVIQMIGINEKGESCCVYINDYQPFFYLRIGYDWVSDDACELLQYIRNKIGRYHSPGVVSIEIVDHYKLYGFSGGQKNKFVKITFKNTTTMNRVRGLWYTYLTAEERINSQDYRRLTPLKFKNITLELYESNIPPLLRYFHIHNVSPSGWIFIQTTRARTPEIKTTTCNFEYICDISHIKSLPDKETIVPYKICSFDGEMDSSHGDFPLPIKTYKRLAMNIVDIFMRIELSSQKLDISRAKDLLKRCILTAFSMDKFDNVDIVYPKNKPSKSSIQSLIQILLNTPLKNAKSTTDEDNSHLLDLDYIFEQIKQQTSSLNQTNDNNMNDDDENNRDELESAPIWTKKYNSTKKMGKAEEKQLIVEILLNPKYERDAKIQYTNEVLTKMFPRLEGDKVTFIGSTFLRYGDPEPYLNHCLVLGSCDPVEGAVIESVDTEMDLLLKWRNLIQTENPDVIIGYNIFGFDYEFMFRRAQENHCEHEFLKLSRKCDEVCAKETDGVLNIENTKIVLSTGEYDLRFYKTIGRLQIDMYTYFRRDFNLTSYKLDDVAGQYISDSIKHINHINDEVHGNVTELISNNLAGLHIGDFIHIQISGFTSDYYKDGKKFRVLGIDYNREICGMNKNGSKSNVIIIGGTELSEGPSKNVKWCMAKDDVSPQDIFRLSKGTSSDRAIVAKYCIQDCNLVHHLMSKIDVLTGYVEMSSICSVPISFLVFRGQGIKLTSYVAKKCREKDTLMPDLEKGSSNDGYEGAIVLPPKCSMYMDNPVACVDYASLYPSSMISQNYSHDSKVWTKEYDLNGTLVKVTGERDVSGKFIYDNLPGYQYIDIEFDTYRIVRKTPTSRAEKIVSGKKICRWAQLPDDQKSIMPAILEELLKARKSTRKKIKTESDPFMQNILDKRQLGYKVTANSLYGQCGARTSTFYEQDVAASTTATGRMMIIYAKRMVEEVYGNRIYDTKCGGPVKCNAEYIYGDTDSVFFTFNLEDHITGAKIRGQRALEMTIEIAQDVGALCSQFLKAPQCLEYEKTLMPFILLSKKRYVGMLYEEDATKGYLKYMGLSLKRRDSCDYLKDTYGEILNILMRENNIQKAIEFLNKSLDNLIEGTVPMEKLTITKALRSDYKNPMQIGHWVLAERIGKRDPGNRPKPGDRMKFVFIVNNDKKALMGDKIETTDYILEQNIQIDYTHYITNQLMKPLQQLFGLALEPIWENQHKTAAIKMYRKEVSNIERNNPDMELFMKKKEKYCSAKIKTLLFDKFLTKIEHKRTGMRPIDGFFR
jgi:DNA polymerase elongation subunit (family B)